MLAMTEGYPEIIQTLIDLGANKHSRDSAGRTALHYACRAGSLQNLEKLIETFQQESEDFTLFEARSLGGITPLMSAIQSGNPYIVGHCLNRSFNPF